MDPEKPLSHQNWPCGLVTSSKGENDGALEAAHSSHTSITLTTEVFISAFTMNVRIAVVSGYVGILIASGSCEA